MTDGLKKNIKQATIDLQKTFGKGIVGSYEEAKLTSLPPFSTGSIGLDLHLNGGYPRGKITEIFGPESSGKTTSALHAIADCQRQGGTALFIDLEGSFDPEYAEAIGVNVKDPDKFLYSSPDLGEEALEVAEKIIRTGEIDLVVVDSVATLLPGKEAEGDYGDASMGSQARLMSQGCRKLNPVVKKYGVAFIFINQLRDKIGVSFGNPEVTSGGNALKFYASVRVDIRRNGTPIKDKDGNVIGEPRRAKVVKSKISSHANAVVTFDIYYGKGIDQYGEILDMAVEANILQKSGAWYSYEGTKVAQGREASKLFLQDNLELFEEIRKKVFKLVEN